MVLSLVVVVRRAPRIGGAAPRRILDDPRGGRDPSAHPRACSSIVGDREALPPLAHGSLSVSAPEPTTTPVSTPVMSKATPIVAFADDPSPVEALIAGSPPEVVLRGRRHPHVSSEHETRL
jgi:hypothetical protein